MSDNKYRKRKRKNNKSTINTNNQAGLETTGVDDTQPKNYDKDINFAYDNKPIEETMKKPSDQYTDNYPETSSPQDQPLKSSNMPDEQIQLTNIDDDSHQEGNKALGVIAIVLGILIIAAGLSVYRFFSEGNSTPTTNPDNTNIAQVTDGTNSDNEADFEGIVLEEQTNNNNIDSEGIITSPSFLNRLRGRTDDQNNNNITDNPINNTNTEYEGIINVEDEANNQDTNYDYLAESINNKTMKETNIVNSNKPKNDLNTQLSSATQTNSQLENTTKTKSTWVANDYEHGDITTGEYKVVRGDTLWELAEGAYGDGSQWHKIADYNHVSYLPNGNPLIVAGQTITIP